MFYKQMVKEKIDNTVLYIIHQIRKNNTWTDVDRRNLKKISFKNFFKKLFDDRVHTLITNEKMRNEIYLNAD